MCKVCQCDIGFFGVVGERSVGLEILRDFLAALGNLCGYGEGQGAVGFFLGDVALDGLHQFEVALLRFGLVGVVIFEGDLRGLSGFDGCSSLCAFSPVASVDAVLDCDILSVDVLRGLGHSVASEFGGRDRQGVLVCFSFVVEVFQGQGDLSIAEGSVGLEVLSDFVSAFGDLCGDHEGQGSFGFFLGDIAKDGLGQLEDAGLGWRRLLRCLPPVLLR